MLERFVGPAPKWPVRVGVLLISFAAFFIARDVLSPWVQRTFFGFQDTLAPGPKLFIGHLVSWQGAQTLVAATLLLAFVRTGLMKGPERPEVRASLRWGIGMGLGLSVFTATLWFFAGPGFGVDVNVWKMAGNLFSNFYEELGYRALLFGAGLVAFRNFWPAAILAGLAFGLSHQQYPMAFRLITAGVGVVAAAAYFRSGSLLAPWIGHQLSDMILDTFLKT